MAIPGVLLIEPKVFGGHRGFFLGTFQAKRYQEEAEIENTFVQDNIHAPAKVSCVGFLFKGKIPKAN